MRRLLTVLMLLAAAAVPATVAAGCGSEDLPSVSVAEAAQATRDAETARVTMRVEVSGMGLPKPVTLTSEGVSATDAPRMDLTADFAPLLDDFGVDADGEARFLLDGTRIYVDPPDIEQLELPDDATWIALDVRDAAKMLGLDVDGLGELFRMTPEQQIMVLAAAGSIKEVGEEEVDGVRTTRLRGTVTLRDFARTLPADRRRRLDAALGELAERFEMDLEELDAPTATDVWIDEDSRIRRMTQKSSMPADEGVPGGTMEFTTDYSDFGTPLELDVPDDDDVYDVTDDVARLLRAPSTGQSSAEGVSP